ncbi:MAG TPA: NAD(P)/FAD-dependent oxidoreductase [Parachlamydiaceae bacterium]|nr:NAD(P)/FAD-dependent oxidoreductase [Parachlamydiaceae bacterium]
MSRKKIVAVVGGGAAGFFGAIACAEADPDCRVIILEKARQILAKVRISGGGRCNVTHSCFDPAALIQNYPRGSKELRGAFSRFQPRDTIEWFQSRGVELKTEADGRMFPTTDSSETIIACLLDQVKALGIELWTERGVVDCNKKETGGFQLALSNGENLDCDYVLVASGSSPKVATWLGKLGHSLEAPVPSLFTFNIPDSPLHELAGISMPKVKLSLEECGLQQSGPLLITHWGFSGPAVLKLSAWGARVLHDKKYQTTVKINWLPDISPEELKRLLGDYRQTHAARLVANDCPVALPKNLWKAFLEMSKVPLDLRWSVLSKQHMQDIVQTLLAGLFKIDGKTTYKDEFVTCGGVKLQEVDFKTLESRICPGLYFAGEVLDVDGVTGGFNFQNAWTTSRLAGQDIAKK